MPKSDVFIIITHQPSTTTNNQNLCHISIRRPIGHVHIPQGPTHTLGQILASLGIPHSQLGPDPSSAHPLSAPGLVTHFPGPGSSWPELVLTWAGWAEARPSLPGPAVALSVLFITRTKREGLKSARSEPLPHIRFQVCDQEY